MSENWTRKSSWVWDTLFIFSQITLIIIYGFCTQYGEGVHPAVGASYDKATSTEQQFKDNVQEYYPMFMDLHVMVFVGFGFLFTFLKTHSWTGIGYTFVISAWVLELTIVLVGFWYQGLVQREYHKINLTISSLVIGDYGALTVMVSFGAILGKCSLHQLWILATFEIIFFALNLAICDGIMHAVDIGGSVYVHAFGAYFGVAASYFFQPRKAIERSDKCITCYNSNLFSMIGSLFLWVYWPSALAVLASGFQKQRIIINTVLAIVSSCVTGCGYSKVLIGRLDMAVVINATMAGGVAIGTTSNLVVNGAFAMLIGGLGGIISAAGIHHMGSALQKSIGLHDTGGVQYVHGLPGIFAGIVGAIVAASCESAFDYNNAAIAATFPGIADGRTFGNQAAYQIYALLITLAISIVGGTFSGFIASRVFRVDEDFFFDDKAHFAEVEYPTDDVAIEMRELGFLKTDCEK